MLLSLIFLFILKGDLNIKMFSPNGNSCTLSLQSTANHFFDNMAKKICFKFQTDKNPGKHLQNFRSGSYLHGYTKNLGEPT